MYVAIFDAGAGFLQWCGAADSIAQAVNTLRANVGDWQAEMAPDQDSIHVYELSAEQAAQVQDWADSGFPASSVPDLEDDGRIYTVAEVRALLRPPV